MEINPFQLKHCTANLAWFSLEYVYINLDFIYIYMYMIVCLLWRMIT